MTVAYADAPIGGTVVATARGIAGAYAGFISADARLGVRDAHRRPDVALRQALYSALPA